jgi:hypothetical protein
MPGFAPAFDGANSNLLPLNTTAPFLRPNVRNAVVESVVGATAGGAMSVNRTQIKGGTASLDTNAGKVVLEVASDLNRNSTAQDVANVKAEAKEFLNARKNLANFAMPRDLSGNGGPAFTRTF